MSLLDLNQIPGYAEAREREQSARDIAFLDTTIPLCGISVNQLTLTHLIILGECENGCVTSRAWKPEDVAFFVWVISPEYKVGDRAARDKFIKRIAKIRGVTAAVRKYLDDAFMDCPPSSAAASKSYASFAASYVDTFASEYGWSSREVLHVPVARLFQLVTKMKQRLRPGSPLFNRSDRLISEHLNRLNAAS